jgi:peptidoglycan/LPS O-acetylase OafA/YrhL
MRPSPSQSGGELRTQTRDASFHDAVRTARYFPALDGLRAVSVVIVLLSHVRQQWNSVAHTEELFRHVNGAIGVTVFFVLSGFLITLLALREEATTGALNLGAFYIRRAFRLFPVYYLVLGVYVVLVLVLHADPRRAAFIHALPFYLGYMQEVPHYFSGQSAPFEISWSLGIEEKFYLVWPIVAFVGLRTFGVRVAVAIVVLLAGYLLPARLLATPGTVTMVGDYSSILLGCTAALLTFESSTEHTVAALARRWVPIVALALAALSGGELPVIALATCLLLPSLVVGEGAVARTLSMAPLVWLGRRSYAIYLTHQLALGVVRRAFHTPLTKTGDLVVAILGLALVVPIVALLYRFVEKPLIERGHRMTRSARIRAGRLAVRGGT